MKDIGLRVMRREPSERMRALIDAASDRLFVINNRAMA